MEQARARGVPVDNDVGLLFRALAASDFDDFDTPPRVVCVTGSNGKSTTTALIGHILETAHVPCQVGGNIGKGVLALDPIHDGDVLVLDTGATFDGYFCDFDRNFALASADDAARRAYRLLHEATEAGFAVEDDGAGMDVDQEGAPAPVASPESNRITA